MKIVKVFFLILTIIFLVAFPKGGFKVGGIPITWGYLILMLSVIINIFGLFDSNGKIYLKHERQSVLLLCLPFILYTGVVLLTKEVNSLGFLFSYILSLLFMPIFFLVNLNKVIDNNHFDGIFLKTTLWCLRFVIVFGLLLFIYKLKTNNTFEIPLLTVNIDDANSLEEKFNSRGNYFKLVSTYNNGNIYGVCMLILLPLYIHIEKYNVLKVGFFLALFLTLSRTVWIGIFIYFLLIIISHLNSIKGWAILTFVIIVFIFFVPVALNLLDLNLEFLFDRNLGGRLEQLSVFDNITIFGEEKYNGIGEIVYTSVLQQFGIIGLILYFVYISAPLIIYRVTPTEIARKKIHWGLIIYVIISASDGAILFIPTMAFFWFIASYIFKPIEPGNNNEINYV